MRQILLFISFLFLFLHSIDAQSRLDSLQIQLQEYQVENNSQKVGKVALEICDAYYAERAFSKVVAFLPPVIESVKDSLEESLLLGNLYSQLGYYQKQIGFFGDALRSFELALDQFLVVDPNSDKTIYTLKEAAQLCTRLLEYTRALAFTRTADHNDRTGKYRFAINKNYFMNYYFMNENEEAEHYFQKAKLSISRIKDQNLLYPIAFLNYIKLEEFDKATKILEALEAEEFNKLVLVYFEALLEQGKGGGKTREKFIIAADAFIENLAEKSRDKAKFLCEIGNYFSGIGEFDRAVNLYQKSIIQAYPDFNDLDEYSLPGFDQIRQESWMMTAPQKKGEALYGRFQNSGNIEDLKHAAKCFELGQFVAEEIRRSYRSDAAKVYLGEYGYPGVEIAITINARLYEETNEVVYLQRVFRWMERSRASVLAESIERGRNRQLLAIPDSLVDKERELRQALIALRSQQEQNLSAIDSVQSTYTSLNRRLQSDYPDWEKYLSSFFPLSLKKLQESLSASKASMVFYFWGEKELYALSVNRKKLNLKVLGDVTEIEREIKSFLQFFQSRNQISNEPAAFVQKAYQLYQILGLNELLSSQENIWIIPDGPLSFIPFESLLTTPSTSNNPGSWPYLFLDYNIRIGASASTIARKYRKINGGKIFALAPLFLNNERGLAALPESEKEVRSWQAGKLNSQVGVGAYRNWLSFSKFAPKARIVHLATHARIDSLNFEPQIELSDTTLGFRELYQLEFPNALIILSACESGLGRYQKGEGVMNLNRAFTYNGAAAMISSLWNVNDATTAQIMQVFAKEMENGKAASVALRQAKLTWLQDESNPVDRKSPFFWAALTYAGPEFQFLEKKGWSFWWAAIPLGLFVIMLFWRRRTKN